MVKRFLQRFFTKKLLPQKKPNGFTLLELLIAMVISSLVVGVLLSFLVGLLDSDRKEQAKSTSQNELQSALDYVADDMAEAVFIYDATGLAAIADKLPSSSTQTPVLAFWKRNYFKADDTVKIAKTSLTGGDVTTSNGNKYRLVKCLAFDPGGTNPTIDANGTNCTGTDQFIYSLVVYYLIDDNSSPWSQAARIGRWELKDGIKDPTCTSTSAASACPLSSQRPDSSDKAADSNYYYVLPDQGFLRFDLSKSGTALADKMNKWKLSSDNTTVITTGAYTNSITVLVDYLDDTAYASNQDDGSNLGLVQIAIKPATTTSSGKTQNTDCADQSKGGTGTNSQRVPSDFSSTTLNPLQKTSFYACVNAYSTTPVARVYLRGNAMARLRKDPLDRCLANDSNSSCRAKYPDSDRYLPTSDIRILGRGTLNPNP